MPRNWESAEISWLDIRAESCRLRSAAGTKGSGDRVQRRFTRRCGILRSWSKQRRALCGRNLRYCPAPNWILPVRNCGVFRAHARSSLKEKERGWGRDEIMKRGSRGLVSEWTGNATRRLRRRRTCSRKLRWVGWLAGWLARRHEGYSRRHWLSDQ